MHTSDYGQRGAHEAQCNAIGTKIGFHDGFLCDTTSHIVCMLATQPPAPNIHSPHLKCEHSPLTAENWSHEQDYGVIFTLLYSTCEIAPAIQHQVKKYNSNFNLSYVQRKHQKCNCK